MVQAALKLQHAAGAVGDQGVGTGGRHLLQLALQDGRR